MSRGTSVDWPVLRLHRIPKGCDTTTKRQDWRRAPGSSGRIGMQRGSHRTGAGPPFAALGAGRVIGNAEGTDTMLAWERFLTGEPGAAEPAGNFVVSSWQRSLQFGVDPTGRAAPFAARGDDLHTLRRR